MAHFDPDTDLELTRELGVSPQLIWQCWSAPDLLKQWFTPPPVKITECALDLRPGGAFVTVMEMPDGSEVTSTGCVLHVVPERRVVFTDTVLQDFRPAPGPFMTVHISLVPSDAGTLYHAHVMHADSAARDAHRDMGFETGWAIALDQLEELAAARDTAPLF